MAQVPLARKLAFSASGLGSYACLAAMNAYLMYFYTDIALLSVGLVGLAQGINRICDALNDPLIGYFSDKTTTRWGRRRPWIAVGVLPYAFLFILLFRPPFTTDQYVLFVYLLVISLAWDVFATVTGIPILALATELSSDYQERTQIMAWCALFNNMGSILGGFLPFFVAYFADVRTGYGHVTVLFGLTASLTLLLALFAPDRREPLRGGNASLADFRRSYIACLRNPSFRILLLTFVVMSVGSGIGQAVSIYALVYWLGFAPGEIGLLIPVYLGAACAALPFWTWLSGWIGKDVALKRLLFYEMFVIGAAYFLTPQRFIVYSFMVAAGIGLAGFVLLTSLLADVLDADELQSGTQRAGVFLSFWTLVMKGAMAAGPLLVGWLLAIVGYAPNIPQTSTVIEVMRWLYGPVPACFFVAGYFLFRHFSLTRERLSEIQTELARRRTSVSVVSEVG